jgi:hypothetical protein
MFDYNIIDYYYGPFNYFLKIILTTIIVYLFVSIFILKPLDVIFLKRNSFIWGLLLLIIVNPSLKKKSFGFIILLFLFIPVLSTKYLLNPFIEKIEVLLTFQKNIKLEKKISLSRNLQKIEPELYNIINNKIKLIYYAGNLVGLPYQLIPRKSYFKIMPYNIDPLLQNTTHQKVIIINSLNNNSFPKQKDCFHPIKGYNPKNEINYYYYYSFNHPIQKKYKTLGYQVLLPSKCTL